MHHDFINQVPVDGTLIIIRGRRIIFGDRQRISHGGPSKRRDWGIDFAGRPRRHWPHWQPANPGWFQR